MALSMGPRDDDPIDPLPIHPRDVISLHPKGSCSINIVSWFTIQHNQYHVKCSIFMFKPRKKSQFSVKLTNNVLYNSKTNKILSN